MLKSLKKAVVPGPFSRSRFKAPDQTKEYLIKRNRPVIFSHHYLKKGSRIRRRVWTTYQNGVINLSMLLSPQWRGLDSRN